MSAIFLEISVPALGPLQRVGVTCSGYLHSVLTPIYERLNVFHLPKCYIRKEDVHTEQTDSDCLLYLFKRCLILLIMQVKLNLLITMRGRRIKFIKSPHQKR